MARLTPLGDLITVQSRQSVYAMLVRESMQLLVKELGLTVEEGDKAATRFFVAVMQHDVKPEPSGPGLSVPEHHWG